MRQPTTKVTTGNQDSTGFSTERKNFDGFFHGVEKPMSRDLWRRGGDLNIQYPMFNVIDWVAVRFGVRRQDAALGAATRRGPGKRGRARALQKGSEGFDMECGGKTPLWGRPRHVAARESAVVPAQSKRGRKGLVWSAAARRRFGGGRDMSRPRKARSCPRSPKQQKARRGGPRRAAFRNEPGVSRSWP